MSRRESDREDLLREATALVERAELSVAGFGEPLVVGFRRDGSASVFFGADPVYQFNTAAELRRAYVGGLLYRAERGRLVSLSRQRTTAAVTLVRVELDDQEAADFLGTMRQRLNALQGALRDASFSVTGQVPADADVSARIARWLDALPAEIRVARVPNVR
jgi:hypothetical protein